MKYTVTGPFPVADVAPGGTVDLDPEEVNVDALLAAGHVALPAAKKAPKGGDQ
jgi:hypothetical protein